MALPVNSLIPLLHADRGGITICLFGDSGDGKTAQIGELAEHIYTYGRSASGKPLRTRLYTADAGGTTTIKPYIDLGIIEVVDLFQRPSPWEWINAACTGKVLNSAGKWVDGSNEDIGHWAFEGMSSFANALRLALGTGADLPGALSNKPSQGADKDAHGRNYGLAQDRIGENIKLSFKLPGVLTWTALARRGDDADTTTTILGPQVVGKALTSEIPSWFNFTFRIMSLPADEMTKTAEKHRLCITDYIDQTSRGAKGLGNSRRPLDGGDLPAYIEPASLVQALAMIDKASSSATDTIRQRLIAAGLFKTSASASKTS